MVTCLLGAKVRYKAKSSTCKVIQELLVLLDACCAVSLTDKAKTQFFCWWNHSTGPDYINDNFPLIDKMEKCTVQRIPAGSNTVNDEKSAQQEAKPVSENAGEPLKTKLRRRISEPLAVSDVDASALMMAPENEIVAVAVFLLALIFICLLRGRRKSEAKTQ